MTSSQFWGGTTTHRPNLLTAGGRERIRVERTRDGPHNDADGDGGRDVGGFSHHYQRLTVQLQPDKCERQCDYGHVRRRCFVGVPAVPEPFHQSEWAF